MGDLNDIQYWSGGLDKFNEWIQKNKNSGGSGGFIQLTFDVKKLYALLKCFISDKPNGIYTMMQNGSPIENLFWWDFILQSDKGFIQIWRTNKFVQAICHVEDENFNLKSFISNNLKKYHKEVGQCISKLDKHTVHINHYSSYKKCGDYLWEEINKLNLIEPISPKTHIIPKTILDKYHIQTNQFIEDSIKFHTLAKSYILNSAFLIESFINFIIRMGVTTELMSYPHILNKHLRCSFSDKLKNIKFYSRFFIKDVDLEEPAIKNALELMRRRNKYVHSDEKSPFNTLKEVYYDGDFPLHPTLTEGTNIFSIKQIFHHPSMAVVKKTNKSICELENYIFSLMDPKCLPAIKKIITITPLGYNIKNQTYSVVYPEEPVDFFLGSD